MISSLNNIVTKVVQLQGDEAWGEGGGGNKHDGTLSGENFLKGDKNLHIVFIFWEVQQIFECAMGRSRVRALSRSCKIFKTFPVIM